MDPTESEIRARKCWLNRCCGCRWKNAGPALQRSLQRETSSVMKEEYVADIKQALAWWYSHACFFFISEEKETPSKTHTENPGKTKPKWASSNAFLCVSGIPSCLSLFLSLFYPWQLKLCQWHSMDGCHRCHCQQRDNTAPNAGQGEMKEAQLRTA